MPRSPAWKPCFTTPGSEDRARPCRPRALEECLRVSGPATGRQGCLAPEDGHGPTVGLRHVGDRRPSWPAASGWHDTRVRPGIDLAQSSSHRVTTWSPTRMHRSAIEARSSGLPRPPGVHCTSNCKALVVSAAPASVAARPASCSLPPRPLPTLVRFRMPSIPVPRPATTASAGTPPCAPATPRTRRASPPQPGCGLLRAPPPRRRRTARPRTARAANCRSPRTRRRG